MISFKRGVIIVGVIVAVLILFFMLRGPSPSVVVGLMTTSTISLPVTTIPGLPTVREGKSPDEVMDDLKTIGELLESRDEEDCASIDSVNYPKAVAMCYYQIAVTERNETKCLKIPDVGLQQTCKERIIYHTTEVVYKKNWSYLFEDKK